MTDAPREYDREFTTPLTYRTRRRIGYSHDHGDVTRFVVQLEYRLDDGWAGVVRFDHNPEGEQGHDVTAEGVHMDVYRDGEKIRSPEIFPPMPASDALTSAEEHLTQHGKKVTGLRNGTRSRADDRRSTRSVPGRDGETG